MKTRAFSSGAATDRRKRIMSRTRLTDARVRALRAKKTTRNVRDTSLAGFGVRILPSGGKRFFMHTQHEGQRIWKIVGDPADMTVAEAREQARGLLASLRSGRPDGETLFETVAGAAFRRHGRQWKPSTLSVNRHYLDKHILPRFAGQRIADITAQDVRDWFATMHATPVSADRSMPVLSIIMKVAEADGLRPEGTNPCGGIKRYRRQNRDRFLSEAEIARLGRALLDPSPAVALIRLLALTGCRASELRTLRWTDCRDGHIFLRDSKTGPRMVWLSGAARAVLDALPRMSPWVFPAVRRDGSMTRATLRHAWGKVRKKAGLMDVRLHDLRHTYASVAVTSGETVLAVGRLLGHRDPETTLKYAHHTEADAERASALMGTVLGAVRT
ncbi:Integrase [Candidatus Rhodobacter oscarellae]|uniref:Integrase n=2 Tax=Candidatus Rhodobacter oscarellae TaxID=1675527 RepID=A0A0J9EB58_9RHOB|nr:Integrase [Candidatus Rhodobacter lobularis]